MKSGELFGFLSPNDAGKTTTVRMIAGVIKTDAGSISIMGYDVERDPPKGKTDGPLSFQELSSPLAAAYASFDKIALLLNCGI